jgi:hypothetical protein
MAALAAFISIKSLHFFPTVNSLVTLGCICQPFSASSPASQRDAYARRSSEGCADVPIAP